MNTNGWIGAVLDDASARLLVLEEQGLFPSELRVGSDVYTSFVRLRRRELADGAPLLVLGTTVTEDPALSGPEFALLP